MNKTQIISLVQDAIFMLTGVAAAAFGLESFLLPNHFAAYLLSIEQALYSLLTYIVASKALDFVIDGVEEYTGVTIISIESHAIRQAILTELGSGVTIYLGRGGYREDASSSDIEILYTVITRLEISKLNRIVEEIDATAFITMSSINDTKGGMVRRKGVH